MPSESKKNSLLLASVIHHESFTFFNEFLNSIENQSLEYFDILFVVEMGINLDLKNLSFSRGKLYIENVPLADGPKKNRDTLLSMIHRLNYKIVTLQDSDDLMHFDRLKECYLKLNNRRNTVLVSDIRPFYNTNEIIKSNGVWSRRFLLSSGRPNISYNYYGLGNTAFTGDTLTLNEIDLSIIENIYDWEFYIQLFSAKGFKTIFGKTPVYYRQINNTVGMQNGDSADVKYRIAEKYKEYKDIGKSKINTETSHKFWFET